MCLKNNVAVRFNLLGHFGDRLFGDTEFGSQFAGSGTIGAEIGHKADIIGLEIRKPMRFGYFFGAFSEVAKPEFEQTHHIALFHLLEIRENILACRFFHVAKVNEKIVNQIDDLIVNLVYLCAETLSFNFCIPNFM
jgi:hypothetical protein